MLVFSSINPTKLRCHSCFNDVFQKVKGWGKLLFRGEYINYLTEVIKERFPDKNIDTITGAVNSKRRDKIKQMLKDNKNCIL